MAYRCEGLHLWERKLHWQKRKVSDLQHFPLVLSSLLLFLLELLNVFTPLLARALKANWKGGRGFSLLLSDRKPYLAARSSGTDLW